MAGVRHNKVATLPDEVGAEVNKNEWNEDHIIDDNSFTIAKTIGLQTALNDKEDDLPSMVGNMGKVLAVNGTETGKEWIVAGGTDIIGKQRSWIGI